MIVRELLTRWGVEVDDRKLKALNRKVKIAKKRFDEAGKSAKKMGRSISLFAGAPTALLGGFMLKAASDAEETGAKFGTVFRDISGQAETAAENLDKNFGLSSRAAKSLLADTGDLLTGFGFSQESALDLSNQVQQLAVDLASFTNFSGGAQGASAALTKALLGETESAKSLGIVIRQDLIDAKVQQLRTEGKITNESEQQAKAIAALAIAQEQSKNAIGDFARTGGSFANTLRDVKGEFEDLAIDFGQILLPLATSLLNDFVKPGIKFFRDLSKEMKTVILVIGGLVVALGPMLITIGFMQQGLVGVIATVKILLPLLTGLKLASLGIAALWLGAFAIIFLLLEDIIAFFQGKKSVTGLIVEKFTGLVDTVVNKFKMMRDHILSIVESIVSPIQSAIDTVGGFFDNVGGLASFIGFGNAPQIASPTPQMALAGAGGSTNQNVRVQNTINVPPNTPQQLVGDAVERGVRKSMEEALRQTRAVTEPQVEF